MGIGPFFNDIGGSGIALTMSAFTFTIFFNLWIVIVDIKLIIVWLDRNFKSFIILSPTVGVTARKTQLHLSIICWFIFSITIFLYFFFSLLETFLFLKEIYILSILMDDLNIPVITDDAILPVPINPNFIAITISTKFKLLGKKKAPKKI